MDFLRQTFGCVHLHTLAFQERLVTQCCICQMLGELVTEFEYHFVCPGKFNEEFQDSVVFDSVRDRKQGPGDVDHCGVCTLKSCCFIGGRFVVKWVCSFVLSAGRMWH